MRAFFHARSAVERTHYDTLEVSPKASLEAIKGAYRFLCQKWHPDKNPQGRAEAEQVTRSLNEAYAVLSDPERRAAYDALLTANAYRQARPDSRPRAQARPAGRPDSAAENARGYRRMQAERALRRARRGKKAASSFLTLAVAALIVVALFAVNPGLLRQIQPASHPAARPAQAPASDVYAEYWKQLTALRRLHPELDPASPRYDRDRAQGFTARIGQYMDRGMSPTQALHAAERDLYSP